MIILIFGCMAFHSAFSKTKLKFKMWFLLSLSIKLWFQVLLGCGNALRTQEIKWHMKWVSGQFKFLKISRVILPSRRTVFKEEIFGRNRPMKRRLAIDDRDHASVDQNGAIKSHPFDQRWKAEMNPRCAL